MIGSPETVRPNGRGQAAHVFWLLKDETRASAVKGGERRHLTVESDCGGPDLGRIRWEYRVAELRVTGRSLRRVEIPELTARSSLHQRVIGKEPEQIVGYPNSQ